MHSTSNSRSYVAVYDGQEMKFVFEGQIFPDL